MENLQTILDRVLAGVGEMVAQRKTLIREGVGVPGEVRDQREERRSLRKARGRTHRREPAPCPSSARQGAERAQDRTLAT